ncbi:MAG: hypothetical protein NWQ45_13480 [Congregibacter sp.]|nr:hypothetical protein [Congregibacter sp.]
MTTAYQQNGSDRFFLFFSLALLGLVVVGFMPSFFLRLAVSDTPLPFYLHVHGALLTGWFVMLVAQASLVRGDNLALHRRFGVVVAAYGAAVVIGSLMATLNYVPRELATGATFESDMSQVNPLQASGMPFLDFASALVCFNIASVVGFAAFLVLAVAARRRSEYHKRYVLFASLSIIAPALARISRIVMQTEQSPIIPVGLLVLGLAIVANDIAARGKLHPATFTAAVVLVAINGMAGLFAISPYGMALVRSLA